MSAYIVSHAHIDALLTFAEEQQLSETLGFKCNLGAEPALSDVGRVLLKENERSVNHLYPHDPDDAEAESYTFERYTFRADLTAGQRAMTVIKLCESFDYQACETDDYEQSSAAKVIKIIRDRAIAAHPDYESAPWGV